MYWGIQMERSGGIINCWRWNSFCPCQLTSFSTQFHYSPLLPLFEAFFPCRCVLIQNRLNQQIGMTLNVSVLNVSRCPLLSICMLNSSNGTWNSSKDTLWWIRRAKMNVTLTVHTAKKNFWFGEMWMNRNWNRVSSCSWMNSFRLPSEWIKTVVV